MVTIVILNLLLNIFFPRWSQRLLRADGGAAGPQTWRRERIFQLRRVKSFKEFMLWEHKAYKSSLSYLSFNCSCKPALHVAIYSNLSEITVLCHKMNNACKEIVELFKIIMLKILGSFIWK